MITQTFYAVEQSLFRQDRDDKKQLLGTYRWSSEGAHGTWIKYQDGVRMDAKDLTEEAALQFLIWCERYTSSRQICERQAHHKLFAKAE